MHAIAAAAAPTTSITSSIPNNYMKMDAAATAAVFRCRHSRRVRYLDAAAVVAAAWVHITAYISSKVLNLLHAVVAAVICLIRLCFL